MRLKSTIFVICLLMFGCVNTAQHRADELLLIVGPMIGQHKDNFIRRFGMPTCTRLSNGEICEFIRDLGIQSGGGSSPIINPYTGDVVSVVTRTNSYQAFEKIVIEFDDQSIAVHGKCEVVH